MDEFGNVREQKSESGKDDTISADGDDNDTSINIGSAPKKKRPGKKGKRAIESIQELAPHFQVTIQVLPLIFRNN